MNNNYNLKKKIPGSNNMEIEIRKNSEDEAVPLLLQGEEAESCIDPCEVPPLACGYAARRNEAHQLKRLLWSLTFLALPVAWTIAYQATATLPSLSNFATKIETSPPGGVQTRPLYNFAETKAIDTTALPAEVPPELNSFFLPPARTLKIRDKEEEARRGEHWIAEYYGGFKKFGAIEWPVYWESQSSSADEKVDSEDENNGSFSKIQVEKKPLTPEEDARYRKITSTKPGSCSRPTLGSHVWNNFPALSYQFLGSALLHVDFHHIFYNAISFYSLCTNLHGVHSLKRLTGFVLFTHFFAFLTVLAWNDLEVINDWSVFGGRNRLGILRDFLPDRYDGNVKLERHFPLYTTGLSGVVFGLWGCLFTRVFVIDFRLLRKNLNPCAFWFQIFYLIFVLLLLVFTSAMPNVSWLAHLGGFFSGVGLSLLMGVSELKPEFTRVSDFLPGERVLVKKQRGLPSSSTVTGIILGVVTTEEEASSSSKNLWKVLVLDNHSAGPEDNNTSKKKCILSVKAEELRKIPKHTGKKTTSEAVVDAEFDFLKTESDSSSWDPLACHIFTIAVVKDLLFALLLTTQPKDLVEQIREKMKKEETTSAAEFSSGELFEFWFKHDATSAQQYLRTWSSSTSQAMIPVQLKETELKLLKGQLFALIVKEFDIKKDLEEPDSASTTPNINNNPDLNADNLARLDNMNGADNENDNKGKSDKGSQNDNVEVNIIKSGYNNNNTRFKDALSVFEVLLTNTEDQILPVNNIKTKVGLLVTAREKTKRRSLYRFLGVAVLTLYAAVLVVVREALWPY